MKYIEINGNVTGIFHIVINSIEYVNLNEKFLTILISSGEKIVLGEDCGDLRKIRQKILDSISNKNLIKRNTIGFNRYRR